MSEPKPIASLSSGLLARKGAARPAMRPQGFGQVSGNLEDLGWNDMGFEPPKPAIVPVRDEDHDAFGEDLEEHPRVHPTGLTPVASPVHSQQAEIVHRFNDEEGEEGFDETAELDERVEHAEPAAVATPVAVAEPTPVAKPIVAAALAPRRVPAPRAAAGSKGKAAFTLRLDPERHLKLRLACAVGARSAQQIVTDALDQFLAANPELDTLAQKAKRKG
ncbi:MAG TPA: hypothetical protein VE221_03725 [Sphingomicrobium sp.]|nr:hypothetical protein [Sphingomicrobium sp.]